MFRSGFLTWLLAPLSAVLLTGCSVFGDRSGTEEVAFEVIERIDDRVEIRRYGPRQAVAAPMASSNETNSAFRQLFNYISGDNEPETEISMTAPVQMSRQPELTGQLADDGAMLFFLPAAMASAPQPANQDLRVITIPPRTEAVIRFSGTRGWERVDEFEAELRAALEGTNWVPQGEPAGYFYDPPWTLPWARRNEVSLIVEGS